VRGGGRADQLDTFVAFCAAVEVFEQPLAAAQQHRGDDQVQVVDEPGTKVLLDGGGTTVEPDVFTVGGGEGLLERSADTVGDEMECVPPAIVTGGRG
jgi:hypothetical protein